MYEINTYNLKIYLLILSIIFILTNGVPIVNMFSNYKNKIINNKNLKGDNFIIVNDNDNNNNNYYTINATVVKQSVMYNTYTHYFTGSVILEYKNYIDNHYYCKIDIDIPEQKRNDIINEYIYKYFNLSRNNINLYCNKNECIHKLYKDDDNEELICNIINIKQINNEL